MPALPKVLLLEPNDVLRKLFAGILAKKDYDVAATAAAEEALGFLKEAPIAAIVDIDGKPEEASRFVEEARKGLPNLPVLIMSDPDHRKEFETRFGAAAFPILTKPVSPEMLIKALETLSRPARGRGEANVPDQKQNFMRRAIDLAMEKIDEADGGPFAAVIVRGGKIIAEGWSRVLAERDPTAHAEIMAIREACNKIGQHQLSGCEIYCSCEPCPMCLAALYWARIDRVYYAGMREDAEKAGFDDAVIAQELALPEEKKTLPCRMLLHDEARVIFEGWNKKRDHAVY